MISIHNHWLHRTVYSAAACIWFFGAGASAAPAPIEQEVQAKLDQLRAIKTGPNARPTAEYNRQMDEAWTFYNRNKEQAMPILARELDGEIGKAKRSDMVLLDIGYLLAMQGEATYKQTGKRALLAMNPANEVVQQNFQQLFSFTYLLAGDHDAEMPGFIDKVFLTTEQKTFVPQHSMTLDATLMGVFLYGKYGPDAEAHLRPLLANPKLRNRVLEILVWLGSPACIPEVKAAMAANRDYDTFVRATAVMMSNGGPDGRAAMLAVNSDTLDAKARDYYLKTLPAIKAANYESAAAPLKRLPDFKKLSDDEVRQRLQKMFKNFGKDNETHPYAILSSGVPKAYLIDELSKIRSRMLYRLSDEALSDVQITNALINALQYRAN